MSDANIRTRANDANENTMRIFLICIIRIY